LSRLDKIALVIGIIWGILGIIDIIVPSMPVLSTILGTLSLEVKWAIIGASLACLTLALAYFVVNHKGSLFLAAENDVELIEVRKSTFSFQ
jgi:hypothetical protein